MQIWPFRGTFPDLTKIPSSNDDFFATVKQQYSQYCDQQIFRRKSQTALYIYRIEGATRKYTGLVAGTDIEDYLAGNIRRHERTIKSKEQQQIALLLERKAAVKPVLLTYYRDASIERWLHAFADNHEPLLSVDFDLPKQKHIFWEVTDREDIAYVQQLFREKVPVTYVADGHHRLATVAQLYQQAATPSVYQHVLCAYFPAGELDILDFNRVVDRVPDDLLTMLATLADLAPLRVPRKPMNKHELTLYFQQQWYTIKWKPTVLASYADDPALLDTRILDQELLRKNFSIVQPANNARIHYVEGPKGLEGVTSTVDQWPQAAGFCLHPVALSDIMLLADLERTLPPKSTWFEPRMKNGLVILEVDS